MSVLVSVCLFILCAINIHFYAQEGLTINLIAAAMSAFVGGIYLAESL